VSDWADEAVTKLMADCGGYILEDELVEFAMVAAALRKARVDALEDAAQYLEKYSFEEIANEAADGSTSLRHISEAVSCACANAVRQLKGPLS
jgi:hypothetical protein